MCPELFFVNTSPGRNGRICTIVAFRPAMPSQIRHDQQIEERTRNPAGAGSTNPAAHVLALERIVLQETLSTLHYCYLQARSAARGATSWMS
jgi:hypothetical protein